MCSPFLMRQLPIEMAAHLHHHLRRLLLLVIFTTTTTTTVVIIIAIITIIIIIVDNFCIALLSGVHKLTKLYNIF